MNTKIVIILLSLVGLVRLANGDEVKPPLRAAKRLFHIQNKKNLGLKSLSSERSMIYRATPETGIYNHHPSLVVFQGKLFACWSNGKEGNEDDPGQRVLYATSSDGVNWSKFRVLFDPQDKKTESSGAGGFHVHGKTLVAYYTHRKGVPILSLLKADSALYARTTRDGKTWTKPVRIATGSFMESPLRLPSGRLILSGEATGPRRATKKSRMQLLYSDNPSGLGPWKEGRIEPAKSKPIGEKIFRWSEPCPFVRLDGAIVAPFRNTSGYFYVSISKDNGVSWSVPQPTNFEDSRARFCTGQLPDGRFYIISNPGPGRSRRYGTGNRSLLTISFSKDGKLFDKAFVLRGERAVHRFPGQGKANGWQYPHAVIFKNHLCVIYSINKEDIGITRLALKR